MNASFMSISIYVNYMTELSFSAHDSSKIKNNGQAQGSGSKFPSEAKCLEVFGNFQESF